MYQLFMKKLLFVVVLSLAAAAAHAQLPSVIVEDLDGNKVKTLQWAPSGQGRASLASRSWMP